MSSPATTRRNAIVKGSAAANSRSAVRPTSHHRPAPAIVLSDQTLPSPAQPTTPRSSPPLSTSSSSSDTISTSNAQSQSSLTLPLSAFEKQWTDAMRRQEMETYVKKALLLVNGGVYVYQRMDGLQKVERLLSQLLCDWRSLPEESTKQRQLQREQLEKDAQLFDQLHDSASREQNTVASIVYSIVCRRNVSRKELQRALMVLEGCCLLSPKCSATLANVEGVRQLVRIASDAAVRRDVNQNNSSNNNNSNNNNANSNDEGDGQKTTRMPYDEDEWEDIRLLAIDVLEACLHNSTRNVVMFCEDNWTDPIVAMIRDDSLSIMLRSKSVEFVALLLRFVRQALESDQKKNKKSKKSVTEMSMKSLNEKLEEYLGSKLANELKKMELKVTQDQKTGNVIDLHSSIFDSFITLVDKH